MTRDPCRREMDVLLRCLREDDHTEELWGGSMFRLHLRRRTDLEISGTWYGNTVTLTGAIGIGRVSIRLDFQNGEAARWISAPLSSGGTFDKVFDAAGIEGIRNSLRRHIIAARMSMPRRCRRSRGSSGSSSRDSRQVD